MTAAESGAGEAAAKRRAAYLELLRSNASAPVSAKLAAVNRFFNALPYRSDRDAWGQADHWSTPAELLSLGAGDCEDLAIGKYFALRRLGIARSSLRITYVRDVSRGRPHMVLVHRSRDARLRVMDSRSDVLTDLAARRDLVPIYDFDEDQLAVSAPDGVRRTFPGAARQRIGRWDALLHRVAGATAHGPQLPLLARASR